MTIKKEANRRCEICKEHEGRMYTFYYGKLLHESSNTFRKGNRLYRHISKSYGDLNRGSGLFCGNCVFGFRMTLFVLTILLAGVGVLVLFWGKHLGGVYGSAQAKFLIWILGPFILLTAIAALVMSLRTPQKTMGEVLGIVRNYIELRKQGYNAFFTEDRFERLQRFHM
jgi:hypothetical protein